MRRGSRRLAILMVLGAAANGLLAAGGPVPQLLLDGAVVGRGVFAVGERGAILHSTTAGRSWEPLASHTGATLTGISFAPDGQHGWVVGHEAVIVATADGGKTWHTQPAGENRQDSFLDVLAIDARQAIAIGAYGLFVRTADGGKTWSREKVIEEDFHLNRITRGPTGTLYVAGEHGTLLRSTNAGAKWVPIPAPYEGSFYGILPLEDGQLLAYGLRGHVFRSGNDGAAWEPVPAPQPVLVATALRRADRSILLAGQARGMFVSRDEGRSFSAWPQLTTAVAELLELPGGAVLALGEAGAALLPASP